MTATTPSSMTPALPTGNPPPLALIHIPKTGGSAVRAALGGNGDLSNGGSRRRPLCARNILVWSHHANVKWAFAQNRTPIVTIRDPYARFFSAYEYWRHGSKMYPRTNRAVHDLSFQRFADILGNRSDARHRYAVGIVAGRNVEAQHVSWTHFLRQTWWIPSAHENQTIFVCYGEGSNADGGRPPTDVLASTSEALARHGIKCDITVLRPHSRQRRGTSNASPQPQAPHFINPTINKSRNMPAYESLSAGARAYLERTYLLDHKLWQRQCANGDGARGTMGSELQV